MNRKLNFRAWSLLDKEMLASDGCFAISPDGTMWQYADQGYLVNNADASEKHKEYLRKNDIEIRDEFVLMQSLEIPDVDGKEIFEGDIVISPSHIYPQPWEVRFYAPSFDILCVQTGVHIPLTTQTDYKVIGNIYENPELLVPKI